VNDCTAFILTELRVGIVDVRWRLDMRRDLRRRDNLILALN
jgi:hypothetical protein